MQEPSQVEVRMLNKAIEELVAIIERHSESARGRGFFDAAIRLSAAARVIDSLYPKCGHCPCCGIEDDPQPGPAG